MRQHLHLLKFVLPSNQKDIFIFHNSYDLTGDAVVPSMYPRHACASYYGEILGELQVRYLVLLPGNTLLVSKGKIGSSEESHMPFDSILTSHNPISSVIYCALRMCCNTQTVSVFPSRTPLFFSRQCS
jgi:hypothetical protein